MDLPKNMPMDQLTSLVDILSNKLTGSTPAEIRAVNNSITEKVIDAALFVGLVKEQNSRYIVTETGKRFFQAQEPRGKNEAIRELLKNIDIYNLTTEYLHHNKIDKPIKLDVGSYWNEHFSSRIKDLNEEDLTSTIIFFFRFLDLASLGKFINAGRGRETRIDLDMVELAKYVTSSSPQPEVKPVIKAEKKTAKAEAVTVSPEEVEEDEESVASSLSILKKLNLELVWSDLDSAGARKLIIDKLNVLNNQNIVLTARVEEYQKLEGTNAVLKERVHNLQSDTLFRASVNSIGGIVLGAALTMSAPIYQIIGSLLGATLIAISIFLRESKSKQQEDT